MRKNLIVLALCQALGMTMTSPLLTSDSGMLYANFGWKISNLVSLPFSVLAASMIIYLVIKRHKSVEPALA